MWSSYRHRQVFLGLGSNLHDPVSQVRRALSSIEQIEKTSLVKTSRLYQSTALTDSSTDVADLPRYINAVCQIQTQLAPETLLQKTQAIEKTLGRVRTTNRWDSRIIDIDILLFDDLTLSKPELTVPHYDMWTREFVIYPLAEIAPTLTTPDGTPLIQYKKKISPNGIRPLNRAP